MKKIYLVILVLSISNIILGQKSNKEVLTPKSQNGYVNSSTTIPRNDGDGYKVKSKKSAKAVNLMETSTVRYFIINGVRVILKPSNNDVVSINYFITGGVKNYPIEKQGIENLSLATLVDGGSKNYPKEIFHNLTESKGISITSNPNFDYSIIQVQSTTKTFQLAWDISTDILMNPTWDKASFEQSQNQISTNLLQEAQDPDESLNELARKGTYKGTPYEKNPFGTVESIKSITLPEAKSFYESLLQGNKLVISICGKVDEMDLKKKVESVFGKIQKGKIDEFVTNPPVFTTNSVTIEQREIATNYMRGQLNAPKLGTRDYLALRMAYFIFSDRLFVEVRTKRNLSYAPSATMTSIANPVSYIYVSTTDPNVAAKVMLDEIKKLKTEGFTQKELTNQKESFITSYFMGQETNMGQASALGVAEIRFGYHYAEKYMDEIKSLKLEEVNAAFKKYSNHIQWYYLGDKSKVDENIFKDLK